MEYARPYPTEPVEISAARQVGMATPSGRIPFCRENAITVRSQRCAMSNPTPIAEMPSKLGVPSIEAVESLRLLKSFISLTPRQRREIIELVERLAVERSPAPNHPRA